MVPLSRDTDLQTEQLLVSLIRQSSVPRRLARMRSLSQSVMELSRRAIKRANTTASDDELSVLFIHHFYGESLARNFRRFIDRGKHE
ncbi:MAG: hypothetical protein JXA71_13535 [Chitinispirillaceae bacterium]|nr:hypothetical protein [Chitinispirillaceae bacterium]